MIPWQKIATLKWDKVNTKGKTMETIKSSGVGVEMEGWKDSREGFYSSENTHYGTIMMDKCHQHV